MKVKDAIRFINDSISDIYSPGESESIAFIILDFIGFPRKKIFLHGENAIEAKYQDLIRKIVIELRNSKPIQYILGETEFFGLKFMLNENVLIPRQETEELVMMIIRENKKVSPVILDLGTGSGCIAVTLAKNIPSAIVKATDISNSAIEIATTNALLNGVNVDFIADDIFETQLDKNFKYDLIVSNPPYVRNSEKKFMQNNVLEYEPSLALFVSDENPLEYYKAISLLSMERLISGGLLFVEINEVFGAEVVELFSGEGFIEAEIISDIHEKDRFVKAKKP